MSKQFAHDYMDLVRLAMKAFPDNSLTEVHDFLRRYLNIGPGTPIDGMLLSCVENAYCEKQQQPQLENK